MGRHQFQSYETYMSDRNNEFINCMRSWYTKDLNTVMKKLRKTKRFSKDTLEVVSKILKSGMVHDRISRFPRMQSTPSEELGFYNEILKQLGAEEMVQLPLSKPFVRLGIWSYGQYTVGVGFLLPAVATAGIIFDDLNVETYKKIHSKNIIEELSSSTRCNTVATVEGNLLKVTGTESLIVLDHAYKMADDGDVAYRWIHVNLSYSRLQFYVFVGGEMFVCTVSTKSLAIMCDYKYPDGIRPWNFVNNMTIYHSATGSDKSKLKVDKSGSIGYVGHPDYAAECFGRLSTVINCVMSDRHVSREFIKSLGFMRKF